MTSVEHDTDAAVDLTAIQPWDGDEEVARMAARLSETDREFLSSVLESTADEDILRAAVRGAYQWGMDSTATDPEDPDLIRAERETLVLAKVIAAGLEDGSITAAATADELPDAESVDPDGAAVLDRLDELDAEDAEDAENG